MTMSVAPIASGAITPAPAPIPVQPIVKTRKNVPINSAIYLFIVLGLSDVLLFVIRVKSELQARAEVESVTLDALAIIKVVDPAHAKIDVTLTQLGRVGDDGANAESRPTKPFSASAAVPSSSATCWIQLSTKPMPRPFLNRLIARTSKSDRMPFRKWVAADPERAAIQPQGTVRRRAASYCLKLKRRSLPGTRSSGKLYFRDRTNQSSSS
jgi:hypothetical protein